MNRVQTKDREKGKGVTERRQERGTGSSSFKTESVAFYSSGERIAGDLYVPQGRRPREQGWPAVVLCHGLGGIRQMYLCDIAKAFARRRYVALAFDYRGFGDSEGERGRLFPMEQVGDVRAAVTFLAQRLEVDEARLAAYGTSFGGGVALEAAARDERIGAAVCAVGIADCERWLKDLRRYWEWREFRERLSRDRAQRAISGKSELVEPEEIMVRDPASAENEMAVRRSYPERAYKLTLESGEAMMEFKPVENVGKIAPRATMFIGIEEDTLTPFDQTLELHSRAGEPRVMLSLNGMRHHDIYSGARLEEISDDVVRFFGEYL